MTNFVAGQPFFIDTGQNLEIGQIASGRHPRRGGHRHHPDRSARPRAREWRPVQRQPGPAGRVHGRHARAPELLRLGRPARARRRDLADRGAAAGARAALAVHGPPGQRQRLPRGGSGADRHDRLLRDDPGQADRDEDRHLRRELRADTRRRQGRAPVLLGLRRWHAARTGETVTHTYSSAHVGRREARRRQG